MEQQNTCVREQVRVMRVMRRLKMRELAGDVTSPNNLSNFLNDKTDMPVSKLERLLAAHGLRLLLVEDTAQK